MFKKRKHTDEPKEAQVEMKTGDVSSQRKRKRKSLLHGLRATSWNIIREEVFSDNYAVRTLTHAYGLMVSDVLLENGDESVGLFIHHVGKGKIKAMVTDEILAAGYFVLLLDRETLLTVEEYPFLWTAGLEAIRIDSDGELTPVGMEYTPSDIWLFVNEEADLIIEGEQLGTVISMPEENWEDMNETDESSIAPFTPDIEDEVYQEVDTFISTEDVAEPFSEIEAFEPEDEFFDEDVSFDFETTEENAEEVEELEILPETETEEVPIPMTEEAVGQVIRRFFSEGDLDLAIDPRLFDSQFGDDTVVPFLEERGEGTLEHCVAQISREANQKMRHLYQTNRALLRDKFMTMMGHVCAGVQAHTDLNNSKTGMGQELFALNETRRTQFLALDTTAATQIAKLDEDWNQELEACGKQAYDSAVANHKKRHGYRNEMKRAAVRGELERDIHQGYEYGVANLNVKRKGIAQRLMDAGTNHTLAELSRLYIEQLQEEADQRRHLEAEITTYVRDYHEDELSRVRVLEQEMLHKTKAQAVQEEYESKLSTLMNDLERQAALFDTERQGFVDKLSALATSKDAYYQQYVAKAEARYKSYEEELAVMRQDMVKLDARKTEEHAHQLNVLKDALGASQTQIDLEVARGKRRNRISLALIIGVAIATTSLGVLLGVLASTHLFLR